jgi:hypothetical protein
MGGLWLEVKSHCPNDQHTGAAYFRNLPGRVGMLGSRLAPSGFDFPGTRELGSSIKLADISKQRAATTGYDICGTRGDSKEHYHE